jgi:inner membrane protein
MPTPVAHSLAGGIIYFLQLREIPKSWKYFIAGIFFFIVYSNLPDLDFLPGIWYGSLNKYHHGITHSIFFLLCVALLTGIAAKYIFHMSFWKIAGISFVLTELHLFMDYMTGDTFEPYGVMLFWPFSHTYYISPLSFFPAFPKRSCLMDLLELVNMKAYLYEIGVMLPPFLLVLIYRYKKCRRDTYKK